MIRVNVAKYKHSTQQQSLLHCYLACQEHVTMKTNSHGSCPAVPCCCSETQPAVTGSDVYGVSPSTFFVARCCHSLSLLLVNDLGILHIQNANPADCGSVLFFSLCSSRKHDSSWALQRKAPLVLVVRLDSGLHLKLSFPDCFSCYKHQSHLMWLSGSVLLRGNLSRFISP